MRKFAFMLGVEGVLVSSTDPDDYRVRRGTEKLIQWLKSRGTIYLNTLLPLTNTSGAYTLDCQSLLTQLGAGSGVKRWAFTEMNKTVGTERLRGLMDPRTVITKTAGYGELVDRGETVVHIDVPPVAADRLNLEACGATIIEVPAWKVDRIIFDAHTYRDGWDGPLSYEKLCEHVGSDYLTVDTPYGREHFKASDPGAVGEFIRSRLDQAIAKGDISASKEENSLAGWMLKKFWIAAADVPGEADFLFDDVLVKVFAQIQDKLPEAVLRPNEAMDWNRQEVRKARNEPGREHIEEPFGGFPIGDSSEE